jgi:tetratricopeptide (TPR) repeat protein
MSQIDDIIKQYNSGNLNLALRKLEELVSKNPTKEAYELMAKILLEMGKDDEALEYFEKAGNKEEKARILLSKGMYSEALEELKDVNSTQARIIRATIYLRKEDYRKVIEELNEINDELSSNPLYYKTKGIAEYYLGNYYDALRDLTRGIELYPLDSELYYYRALVKISLNEDKEAENDINTAINLNPYYAEAYFSKGLLKEKKGKYEEAIAYYSKSIDINPEYVEAYVRRAKAYMKSGMEKEAFEDIKVVRELKGKENNKENKQ